MIYLPSFTNNNCIILDNLQNGYIRVYSNKPTSNSTVSYTDYFIDSHYVSRVGTQNFSNNVNVNCVSHDQFTTDYLYRNDLFDIFGVYFIIIFIFSYILTRFMMAFRKRFRL